LLNFKRSNSYFNLFAGHHLRSKKSLTLVENEKGVKENEMHEIKIEGCVKHDHSFSYREAKNN